MSILLEALKRAEEEKKAINRLGSAEESAQRAAPDASISPEDLTSLIARGSKKEGGRPQDASQAEVRRSSDELSLSTASETTDLEASLSQASTGMQENASQSVDADEGTQASQMPISLTLTDSSFESEVADEMPQTEQGPDDHEVRESLATLTLSEMQPEQTTDVEAMETSDAETLSSALTLQEVEAPISSEKHDEKQENRQEKTQDEKRVSEDKTAEVEEAEEEVSSLMEEVIALASSDSDAQLGSETQASSPNPKVSEKEVTKASENPLEKALKEASSASEQSATEPAVTAEEKEATSSTDTLSADATSKAKAEADKSFNWSLKQIPGFQSSKNKKSADKTPEEAARKRAKSFLSLFSSSKKKKVVKKSHRSYRGVLVFLMMLLVIVMGASYWGMGYYQQLAQQNLQEEVRYQRQLQPVQMVSMTEPHSEGVDEETPALAQEQPIVEAPSKKRMVKEKVTKLKAASSPKPVHKVFPKKRIKPERQMVQHHKAMPSQRTSEMSVQTVKVEDPREYAFAALERGDYAQAQADYQKAATLFPKDPQVWMGLGASSLQLGETEKARAYYQRALKLDPYNKAAQKAVLMLSPKHNRKWLDRLERLLAQTPRDPDLYFLKGQYYIQNQDWFLAQQALKKAVELNPRFLEAILNLAIAEDHLGRYKKAFTHYRQVLALAGNHLSDERKDMIANRVLDLAKYVVQ